MFTLPQTLHIGVIRGGVSPEYDVSLKTGDNILKQLSETHRPLDIFISKDGKWHMNGIERAPERILKHVDVVYNALHGEYGEDGGIQELLDHHNIPYTGSNKFSSAMAMNKYLTKDMAIKAGIKTPIFILVREGEDLQSKMSQIHKAITYPLIIKPVSGGSSLGVTKAHNLEEVMQGLQKALSFGGGALVEEYIAGREATCGVINNFRNQSTYSLPPVEIVPPPENSFFDYDSKYSGKTREICPGTFSQKEKDEIERVSALIHDTMGLRHYSRSDFIVSPRRGVYFLEVNTLPGMTKESLFPKSLEAVGVKTKDFIHHIIGMAMGKE